MIKKHFLTTFFALFLSVMFVSAQSKTETIPVSGNCGMCKNSIEKAAKKAGVSAAEWNRETKLLTVTYNAKTTDAKKIQQSIADVGYDTKDIRAADSTYNNLHGCCKYERTKTYTVSTKNKGGDDADCCEKSDKQCCKDKLAAKKAGAEAVCKKDAQGKDCCSKK